MKKVLKYIILLMALILAGTVAYVSVTGLLKLFAGAGLAGAIIFWSIEIGKIIMTSAVHTYKKVIKWYVRVILNIMILFTMAVTSFGIYGFLSSSYKASFANLTATENRIGLLEEKTKLIEGDKELINQQIESKRQRIKDQSSIRDQQETRLDSLYARRWYTAARRTENAIKDANDNITKLEGEITELNTRMNVINDSITSYNLQAIQIEQNNEAATELGPLIYLSDVFDMEMDDIMKWFILLIMVIGDPQAVLLVIIFNSIINKKKDGKEHHQHDVDDGEFDDLENMVPTTSNNLPDYENPPAPPKEEEKDFINVPAPVIIPKPAPSPIELDEEPSDDIIWEESENDPKYVIGVDPATEDAEPTIFKKGEDDNIEVIDTDNTKKYKVELPEVVSDKVSRYNVELPKKEVVIEEKIEESKEIKEDITPVDDDKYWVEDKDSDPEPEDETPVNKAKDFIKGTGVKTKDGYKVNVELDEATKAEKVREILEQQQAEKEDRGFKNKIPKRPNNMIEKPGTDGVFIRKRK
jgi:hypothetical protein